MAASEIGFWLILDGGMEYAHVSLTVWWAVCIFDKVFASF